MFCLTIYTPKQSVFFINQASRENKSIKKNCRQLIMDWENGNLTRINNEKNVRKVSRFILRWRACEERCFLCVRWKRRGSGVNQAQIQWIPFGLHPWLHKRRSWKIGFFIAITISAGMRWRLTDGSDLVELVRESGSF